MKASTNTRKGLTVEVIEEIGKLMSYVPWQDRRRAMAEVTLTLLDGKPRLAENLFGWGRCTVALGMNELRTGIICLNNLSARRKPKTEDKYPEMLVDIQKIMAQECRAEQHLRTALSYTNKTAASVRTALLAKGWLDTELPTMRTVSNILFRQNYRLRRVEKSQVQKKTSGPIQSLKTSTQ